MEHYWVKIKRLPSGEGLDIPERAKEGDAGFDLRAAIPLPVLVAAGKVEIIPTGFSWAIDAGWCGMVCPRSGLAAKYGITVPNAPGIVDSGYRGEVGVILVNTTENDYLVHPGERIAQMVIVPVMFGGVQVVDDLGETERGDGAYGSTGKC